MWRLNPQTIERFVIFDINTLAGFPLHVFIGHALKEIKDRPIIANIYRPLL